MDSMDILKLSAKREGMECGRIKPKRQPAVNLTSTQRYSKQQNNNLDTTRRYQEVIKTYSSMIFAT